MWRISTEEDRRNFGKYTMPGAGKPLGMPLERRGDPSCPVSQGRIPLNGAREGHPEMELVRIIDLDLAQEYTFKNNSIRDVGAEENSVSWSVAHIQFMEEIYRC